MNEHFAIEPCVYKNWQELRALLDRFGPYAGRYIAECPRRWREQVLAHCSEWGEVDQARIRRILLKGESELAFVQDPGLPWERSKYPVVGERVHAALCEQFLGQGAFDMKITHRLSVDARG